MWLEPKKAQHTFKLYGGGTIEFGIATKDKGMSVGTTPMMARITMPNNFKPTIPNVWFKISKKIGYVKLFSIFKKDEENFIPDWLRADLYEHCYNETLKENKRLRTVVTAAEEWIKHLEDKGGHYYDGIPGELMDAIEFYYKEKAHNNRE